MTPQRQAAGILVAAAGIRLTLAGVVPLSEDELVHWNAGDTPFGAILQLLPRHAVVLRAPGVVLQTAAGGLLLAHTRGPRTLAFLLAALPLFVVQGTLALPSSWALGLWGLGLAGALAGGRSWLWTGLCAGAGAWLGYGAALLALPVLAAIGAPGEQRSPWPWVGVALALGALLVAGSVPAPRSGLADFVVAQASWAGVLLPALVVAARRHGGGMLRWVSLPVLVGAGLAAALGLDVTPIEGAMGWWGAALWISRGPDGSWGQVGGWLGGVVSTAMVAQALWGLLPVAVDPAMALHRPEVVADDAARWALPPGVPRHGDRVRTESVPVFTARPEEAAAIRYHTCFPSQPAPGCGGDDPGGAAAVYVAPSALGATCLEGWSVRREQIVDGFGPRGRVVGRWFWAEVERSP